MMEERTRRRPGKCHTHSPATMKIKNNFFPGKKTKISECHFKVLKDAGATVTIKFLFNSQVWGRGMWTDLREQAPSVRISASHVKATRGHPLQERHWTTTWTG